MKYLIRSIAFILLILAANAQVRQWMLVNRKVTESSGVTASIRNSDVYWTHNDSGDGPNLFAFNRQGKDLGTLTLFNTSVRDCEDIAIKRTTNGAQIYFGDIGDNLRFRTELAIYRFDEPKLSVRFRQRWIKNFDKIRVAYPDGARDCETLMAHPTSGDIYLVSKVSDGQSRVYKLANPAPSNDLHTLTYVATVNVESLATGGEISPDGKRLVIRTLSSAYEFTAPANQSFDAIFSTTPRKIALPSQQQGEAICYRRDGKAFILTSEGNPCPVIEMKR